MGARMIQKVELKVGLFIIITTLLIMSSIGYVAYKKGVFSKVYTYTLTSRTGENLTEGMPVVFWGFTIGQVSSMEAKKEWTAPGACRTIELDIAWLGITLDQFELDYLAPGPTPPP